MDRRLKNAREKYQTAHLELITKANQILASGSFTELNFQNLAKYTSYSKTTVYSHFESDINNLYLDVINSFRQEMKNKAKEIIYSTKNTSKIIKQIFDIYEMIFKFIVKNPNLYKNLFLIALLISGKKMENNKDLLKPELNKLYLLIKSKNFEEDWMLFTTISIQYALDPLKEELTKLKKEFFMRLSIDHSMKFNSSKSK